MNGTTQNPGTYRITTLSRLNGEQVLAAIRIFIDGFYNIFSISVTRDRDILCHLFEDSFVRDKIFICLDGDTPVGFLGLADCSGRVVKLHLDTCIRLFGKRKGKMLYRQMGKMLEKINVKTDREAYIDFVATDDKYRGKGVATRLFRYIFRELPYRSYTLDVLSKNIPARHLYETLGFQKVKTLFSPLTVLFGFGSTILMNIQLEE